MSFFFFGGGSHRKVGGKLVLSVFFSLARCLRFLGVEAFQSTLISAAWRSRICFRYSALCFMITKASVEVFGLVLVGLQSNG